MSDQELGSPYHSPWSAITRDVFKELRHQDGKWGVREPDHHSPAFWMLIATEEFGEVAKSLLEHSTAEEIHDEIADLIAVLVRVWMYYGGDNVSVGHAGRLHSAYGDGSSVRGGGAAERVLPGYG